ncbi:DUF2489 domain-containing protein [Salinisphaera shabanensis]|uniref:DUF2489 domain-containing protein n=1 Tax=Salinisphaera shabanensis TaxID=180542 RepID=UPI00333EBE40
MIWLAILAAVVILALAGYAGWLWWRVINQQKERETHNAAVLAETEADLEHSIAIIADSLLTGELNLSEGAIRLKVLLDHYHAPGGAQADYPAIYSLFLSTSNMPRGEERDAWPRNEIRRMDREREMLEVAAKDSILDEAARLRERFGVPSGREGLASARPVDAA